VMALYGFSVLTPSWGGLALVVLGVVLLVVDLHAPTHGVLTIGGLISLGFGLALLFQNEPAAYRVNLWLVLGIGSAIAAFWVFATGKALAARRLPVETGVQMMIGQRGEVRAAGLVFVDGALWQAQTADESELVPGEQVEIQAVDGLRLTVRRPAHGT
jgi:membrane-bound serine protease (ClpP class)